MTNHFNSEIDKIDPDPWTETINALIVCVLGLAASVVVYYNITGGL